MQAVITSLEGVWEPEILTWLSEAPKNVVPALALFSERGYRASLVLSSSWYACLAISIMQAGKSALLA
jgi:hypothetical protein